MTQLTQRQKIEGYDSLKAERDKLSLALYDLVNHKWSLAKTYTGKWVRENITADYDGPSITVACSWRAMPLFLVRQLLDGRVDVEIYTEEEIQRMASTSEWRRPYVRILAHARAQLCAKYFPAIISREVSNVG